MKTPLGRFRIAERLARICPRKRPSKAGNRFGPSAKALQVRRSRDVAHPVARMGLEAHNANTYERYVYIHGTNHEEAIGEPASHGCIRMRNNDVAELFDLVKVVIRRS